MGKDPSHASPDRSPRRSPPRDSRRGVVLVGVLGLLVGALAGSLAMALAHPQPDTSAIDAAQETIRVTGVVSIQPVRAQATLTGTVTAPTNRPVMPAAAGTGGADVVTGRARATGEVVHVLDVIAEVSDRPVFAFPEGTPLFRDLAPDMTGSDVAAVQQVLVDAGLLTGKPSARMDAATSNAIAALFKNSGYTAPLLASVVPPRTDPVTGAQAPPLTRAGLPLADVAIIPADGLPITQVAPVGQAVGADHPLVALETRAAAVTARADLLAAPRFTVGTAVRVQVGANPAVPSTVLGVSDFAPGGNGVSPGYDVTIGLPQGIAPAEALNQPVVVTETAVPPDGPAVPLVAVRTDALGSYVWQVASDPAQPDTRVGVTIVGQAGGYAILAEGSDLPVGTAVVLAGERT